MHFALGKIMVATSVCTGGRNCPPDSSSAMGSSPVFLKQEKAGISRPFLIWYGRQDLNLHGNPLEPKSNVSANSTTPAFFNYLLKALGLGNLNPTCLPVAVPDIFLDFYKSSSAIDRGHALRSLLPPPAALPSLPSSTTSALASFYHGVRFLSTHIQSFIFQNFSIPGDFPCIYS